MNQLADVKRVEYLARHEDAGGALQRICDYLRDQIDHYDWVGFYLADPADQLLLLGPFSGAPTEHVKIPYGRGICGQAAGSSDAFVVPDVMSETNYLSCSAATRAEIVIPIWHAGEFVGELDIDSHTADPFTGDDDSLLSTIVEICAPLVSSILAHIRPQ
jgi:L-methionine (R)-S-oxide reductase